MRISFRSAEGSRSFYVRCLPTDFPEYEITGPWKNAPRLTVAQVKNRYAVALDRHGTPVWWFRAPEGEPIDAKFLGDGTFAYAPVSGISFRHFVIRSIDGSEKQILRAGNGLGTDSHDLQRLPNGNYLIGSHRLVKGVDTTPFGGKPNATIDTTQVQEITPRGAVVWSWNAFPRIQLRETGRWWKRLNGRPQPYDVNHWNSIERRGNLVLLSFRHQDAIYAVDRRTGRIRWKLGGTHRKESLVVKNDPAAYPLGGQHDARLGPDGSITVFDNATYLHGRHPRAVRYRIDPRKRIAVLEEKVMDPDVRYSVGFGSARLDLKGHWTIGWGAMVNGTIGAYGPHGTSPSRLLTPGGASYRANPVTTGSPTIPQLRRAMDRMADRES